MAAPIFALGIAWDIIQDIRGTVAMLMFIMEESIQTAMMAEWIATQNGLYYEALDLNQWTRQYLAQELFNVCDSAGALAAYPLNLAYTTFAMSTFESLNIYKKLLEQKIAELYP